MAVDAKYWDDGDLLGSETMGFVLGFDAHFTDPQPTGEADPFAPQVGNFLPAPGSAISRFDPIRFDVTDDVELRKVVVMARFTSIREYEVVWDGDAFAPRYTTSKRADITGGHRYTLHRDGGWPSSPTIRVVAIDTSGNEDA